MTDGTHWDSQGFATSDGAGGVFAACAQSGGVHVYKLDSHGRHLWPSTGVRLSTASATMVSVASDHIGGLYVSWADGRHGDENIFAQRVGGTGELLWGSEGVTVCNHPSYQHRPQLVSNGSNGCTIVWQDGRHAATRSLYCQFVSPSGNISLKPDGILVGTSTKTVTNPLTCSDGSGGVYVLWESGNFDLILQRIGADGQAVFNSNGLLVAMPGDHPYQKMAADGTGGVVLTWRHGQFGPVYAQRISHDGNPLWTEGGLNVSVAGSTRRPNITSDDNGGAVVVWGRSFDIFAQKISPSGLAEWTAAGVPVCTAWNEDAPVVSPDENGGYIIAFRQEGFGLFASRLNSEGQLGANAHVEDWQLF